MDGNGGSFCQSRLFGCQINGDIFVGGVDAAMAQPVCNGAQVHAGSQQVDGGAVAQAVGMDAFGFEGWHDFRRFQNMAAQNETRAKACEWLAPMVLK